MESHELNKIKEVEFEGKWVEVYELLIDEVCENYLFIVDTEDNIYHVPHSGYHDQSGELGEIYWDEIQKESEVVETYLKYLP